MSTENEQNVTEKAVEVTNATFAEVFDQVTNGITPVETTVKDDKVPIEASTVADTEHVDGTKVSDSTAVTTDKEKPLVEQNVEQTDYKVLLEKEQQRNRSWEGRIAKSEKRSKELQEKLDAMEVKSAPTTTESLVDVEDPLIQGFIKEMGDDFIKPLDAYIKKTINEAIKPFSEKVPVIEQQVSSFAETKAKDHYSTILASHSDVAEILEKGELEEYVNGLPYSDAVEKKKIIAGGSTQQVIGLLDEFKEKTGKVKSAKVETETVITKPSKEKITAATAVKGGSYTIPKGKPNADDFNGAFAEAVEATK